VRLNEPHPSPLTPSWCGDSVGHYERDALVIDTVAIKTDRKYAMIDLFGTPYTEKLHIVERYQLLDPAISAASSGVDAGDRRKARPRRYDS